MTDTWKRRLIDQIGDSPTFVAEGSCVTGDLETAGPLVVCGAVRGDGRITRDVAEYALERLEVDAAGLDAGDRRILSTIVRRFDGGPVGIESLAASLAEDRDTLEFVYEPYLIQEGFLLRTPRGRQVTRRTFEHLGLPPPPATRGQGNLF